MTTATKLSKAELFSLGQWLSDWPENWSYQQVIDTLETESGWIGSKYEIYPWQVIEDYPARQIAEFIEDTRKSFERFTQ